IHRIAAAWWGEYRLSSLSSTVIRGPHKIRCSSRRTVRFPRRPAGLGNVASALLYENVFPLALDERQGDHHERYDSSGKEACTDRSCDEYAEIAAGYQQSSPEILLDHRAEDETEYERRQVAIKPREHVAEQAEDRQLVDREGRVADREHADAAEGDDQ